MKIQLEKPDINSLPESPGLYTFHLKIADLAILGLRGNADFTNGEINNAKLKLLKRINRLKKIYEVKNYKGKLSVGDGDRVSEKYKLEAKTEISLKFEFLKNRLEFIDDISNLVKILNSLNFLMPPLYVGITVNQGLKTRYWQHKRNYEKNESGTFGSRLKSDGLLWSDLEFHTVIIPSSIMEKSTVQFCESLIHAFGRPIYSYS
ncbi:MAG: hypothetical protein CMQ38_12090 [Gammaproteobacteria bacterium]|nr:hypothetical protein [Gammaproteobacteria bacterium]|tara:strand:+ start:136 stop:750 length:615 start_codon:yes stop_codon:yes gene_type:complete